jgi:hypothetical protein
LLRGFSLPSAKVLLIELIPIVLVMIVPIMVAMLRINPNHNLPFGWLRRRGQRKGKEQTES